MSKYERIGIEFTTNEEYQVIVIDYISSQKVKVMFLDDYKYKMWTTWSNLQKGTLKNPFHKSVFGVGFLGTDENGEKPKISINKKVTKEYRLWSHMLERCYDEKYHEKYPTYKNCTVAEEWHNFSKFLKDLPKIKNYELWRDNDNYALNKDKYYSDLGIITDEKEYSLLTTRFINQSENVQEMIGRCGTGNPKKKVKCIETGIIYDSLTQAEKETGISLHTISKCCNGKLKTCHGLHWEFVN